MKRERGFYFVKYEGWTIGYWDSVMWNIIGSIWDYDDKDMDIINETRITMPYEII